MRFNSSTLFVLLLLVPVFVAADEQPSVRVHLSELDRTPLIAGPLKITLTKFKGSFLKVGGGYVEIRVENTSTEFATFSPQLLSFVSNNDQVDILFMMYGEQLLPPQDRRIVPGARIKEEYRLNGKVRFPARLYYRDKLLAVITD
jgi:hypothetical protein